MVYPDGSRYQGNWNEGDKSGEGSYFYSNGDLFQGIWKNDMKDGDGVYHYTQTGSKFAGMAEANFGEITSDYLQRTKRNSLN